MTSKGEEQNEYEERMSGGNVGDCGVFEAVLYVKEGPREVILDQEASNVGDWRFEVVL